MQQFIGKKVKPYKSFSMHIVAHIIITLITMIAFKNPFMYFRSAGFLVVKSPFKGIWFEYDRSYLYLLG